MPVQLPDAARDFAPRLNFQCPLRAFTQPACATACSETCRCLKNPSHTIVWTHDPTLVHTCCVQLPWKKKKGRKRKKIYSRQKGCSESPCRKTAATGLDWLKIFLVQCVICKHSVQCTKQKKVRKGMQSYLSQGPKVLLKATQVEVAPFVEVPWNKEW